MLSTPRPQQPERRAAWVTVVAALAALAALFAIRSDLLQMVPKGDRLVSQLGIFVLAVVLGGLAVRAIISRVFAHLRGTALYAWRPVTTWGLYILSLAVLSALQINLTGLLAASAIVGVVVGVAAQTSLGSVFAGLVLLMARPFVVGNWVHIRSSLFGPVEYAGVVTHVGVVYTTVDVSGRPVRIPNSGVLVSALTVTHIPLQVDIELQLRPDTSLVQLSHRLERKLELPPGETVELRPLRLDAAAPGALTCQLQIRSHRPIDLARVSRVVLEGEASGASEGGGPGAPALVNVGAGDRYRWAEPGLEEVADGVFRCPLPLTGDALRAVNAYLVRSDQGYLLVDCGWDSQESRSQLAGYFKTLGAGLGSIQVVFATHCHWDHLGAAGWIRQESGAWVTLGHGDRDTATTAAENPERSRQASLDRLRALAAADVAERLLAEREGSLQEPAGAPLPDLFLVGAELLRHGGQELEVLATPGHTRGHLCLFDRARGILLAGDHVLPQITPSLGVELPLPGDSPLASFISSLELVRELPARTVLPAHGPAFGGLRERVDELLEHHRDRLAGCLELVAPQGSSAREVAGRLPWTRRRRAFSELDGFNQMLAVFESDAHLKVLVEQGRLRTVPAPSGTRYLLTRDPSGPSAGRPSGPEEE